MSRWLDRADALKARIEAVVPGIDVIVDRQKNISSMVALAVGKGRGACVTILWTGGTNADPKSNTLRMGGSYIARIYCLPVIQASEGLATADDLAEAVAGAMHDWDPVEDNPNHQTQRMAVTGVEMEPHTHFLVYAIEAEVKRL